MSDLVERLKTELREANEAKVDLPWLEEAITALSPPLPDDVAEHCKKLRYWETWVGEEAADLLERQVREIATLQAQVKELEDEIKQHRHLDEISGRAQENE